MPARRCEGSETMKVKTDFKYVGTRPIRPDGLDKVTGRAMYGADLNLQRMV